MKALVGTGTDVAWRLINRLTRGADVVPPSASTPEWARYCYSVWLRHLSFNQMIPGSVLELGPGPSMGVGYAALLSGTETYVALDAVARATRKEDSYLLNSIAELFASREPIPGPVEFPGVLPTLSSYDFPISHLSDDLLERTLTSERKASLATAIRYIAPWSPTAISPASIDLILSQAVMEHVQDPDGAYAAMATWLRPGGIASHQIDFRSHGLSRAWNGHWQYPARLWPRLRGKNDPINRWPLSAHCASIERAGLTVKHVQTHQDLTGLRREDIDPTFRWLTDEDLVTAGAFIQIST